MGPDSKGCFICDIDFNLILVDIFFKKTHQWLYISGFFSVISSAKNVLENLERLPQILVTDFDVIFVLELFYDFLGVDSLVKYSELQEQEAVARRLVLILGKAGERGLFYFNYTNVERCLGKVT